MLNKILVSLIIVLFLLVGFLFYKVYVPSGANSDSSVSNSSSSKNGLDKSSKIVFVNTDTLFDKYLYYKEVMKSLEDRKRRIEVQFESQARGLESQVAAYQEKGKMGNLTAAEIESTEARLMRQRDDIIKTRDEQLSKLVQEEREFTEKLYDELYSYVTEYNKQNGFQYVLGYTRGSGIIYADNSLDITNDVVKGLNERYTASKK